MTGDTLRTSPRRRARLAGVLYVVSGVPAGFAVFVFMKLLVRGDPAATAAKVLGSEGLFRLGLVADLVGILFFVSAVVLLYELFRAVNKSVALISLTFSLMGAVIQALDALQDLAALQFLKGGTALTAVPADQAHAMAHHFLRLHALGYDLAFVFYGPSILVMAYLVGCATFLPRVLGVLLAIDGAGYLTFAFVNFLSPPLATRLYPYLPFVTAILGEASFIGWLIVKGVDSQRWREQAASVVV